MLPRTTPKFTTTSGGPIVSKEELNRFINDFKEQGEDVCEKYDPNYLLGVERQLDVVHGSSKPADVINACRRNLRPKIVKR